MSELSIEELATVVLGGLEADRQIALQAGGWSQREWAVDVDGKDALGMPSTWPLAVRWLKAGRMVGTVAHLPIMDERSRDRMEHVAHHDPARVLAAVAGWRTLLDEALEWKHHEADDPFYSCPASMGRAKADRAHAGPCDCGRDERVRAVLEALAAPYQEA